MNFITIQHNGERVTIETSDKSETLQSVLNSLVIPALLGLTFSEKLLTEYFNDTNFN